MKMDFTNNQSVRNKFRTGKFILSVVGILKISAIILFFMSAAIFLATTDICPDTPSWFPWLLPSVTIASAVAVAVLYGVFAGGVAKKNPNFWVKLVNVLAVPNKAFHNKWLPEDIGYSVLDAILTLAIGITSMSVCQSSAIIYTVPGPMAVAGGVALAVSAAWLFVIWRLARDTDVQTEIPTAPSEVSQSQLARKSVFA